MSNTTSFNLPLYENSTKKITFPLKTTSNNNDFIPSKRSIEGGTMHLLHKNKIKGYIK